MDAQKVDMYIMSNGKFFESFQLAQVRERLLLLDDSKWAMVQMAPLKDPQTALLLSIVPGFFSIFGVDIKTWILSQGHTLVALHTELAKLVHSAGATLRWVDQSPLIGGLDQSWRIGINPTQLSQVVDVIEPLFYRQSTSEIINLAQSYLSVIRSPKKITGILRPTFPDNSSQHELIERVKALKNIGVDDIDFYLFDVWRERDLVIYHPCGKPMCHLRLSLVMHYTSVCQCCCYRR